MRIDVAQESFDALAEYATIPIAFEVRRVLDVSTMTERLVDQPYLKDYDAAEPPTQWPVRFDVSRWALFAARVDGRRIGGAAIVLDTRGVAALWDLRVAPEFRGKGAGAALFHAIERWAIATGCAQLEVETQDINVPACRFYARMGCQLGAVRPHAYAEFPDEVQLIWHKRLSVG